MPERITYEDDDRLPEWGYGITNIVPRATAGIDELTPDDYRAGARRLLQKIRRHKPEVVALVGVTVWRALLEALGERDLRREPVTLGFQTADDRRRARVCAAQSERTKRDADLPRCWTRYGVSRGGPIRRCSRPFAARSSQASAPPARRG